MSEHNFKVHIMFTRENTEVLVILWLAQSHTAGSKRTVCLQFLSQARVLTQYYFCAWHMSPPDQPCRLMSGWMPASLIKCLLSHMLTRIQFSCPNWRDSQLEHHVWRDPFPWWFTTFGESSSHQTSCFVASTSNQQQKSSVNIWKHFVLGLPVLGGMSWFNHSTCKSWRISSGYLRRYRSHHLRSWDILCPAPSPTWSYKAIYAPCMPERTFELPETPEILRVWCVGFKDFLSSFSK